MTEFYRKKTKRRTVLVLSANEFGKNKKGYVVYEAQHKKGKYFGNPLGVIWKSKAEAIQQAKLRTKFPNKKLRSIS